MNRRPIFANIRDHRNRGDMLCGAKQLFPEFADCPELDFRDVEDGPAPLILGGGGMLHPGVDDWIGRQAARRPVFLLGVGINYHDGKPLPDWYHKVAACQYIWLRDRIPSGDLHGVDFCPCPTLGALDWAAHYRKQHVSGVRKNKILIYEHLDHPIDAVLPPGFPRERNLWCPDDTLEKIATHFSSFRRILTNSYHGALWGALCGCETIIWKPFSTRFRTGLPFEVPCASSMDELSTCLGGWAAGRYSFGVEKGYPIAKSALDEAVESVRSFLA